MSALPKTFFTPEEYLTFERASEERHEYWDGEIFMMSGASRAHNLIASNVNRELGTQLKNGRCEACVNDMGGRIPRTHRYD